MLLLFAIIVAAVGASAALVVIVAAAFAFVAFGSFVSFRFLVIRFAFLFFQLANIDFTLQHTGSKQKSNKFTHLHLF